MAKNLYHKSFKEMGPVTITVKSERTKSKFSKPGAPKDDYVMLVIGGVDYSYNTENENCANFFTGKVGQTIAVVADGSRADATIQYVGEPASNLQKSQQQQAPPQQTQQQQKPPATNTQTKGKAPERDWLKETKHCIGQNAVLAMIALEAHAYVSQNFHEAFGAPLPDALQGPLLHTLLYGTSQKGYPQGLPLGYKMTAPKAKGAK